MTPTFLDDFTRCIDLLIQSNQTGIFHTVGDQSLTPFDAANLIAQKFGYDQSLIAKTTRARYFKDRAPRPFNLSMNNDKIRKLGVSMRTFEEGLKEIQNS
jgi:dTDP-4-dehydrorhamnose reductase